MTRRAVLSVYVPVLVVVVVGVDVLFFRHRFWERLIANVGIVLVFGAVYFAFLKRQSVNERLVRSGSYLIRDPGLR